jgi:hypothetical protein
MDCEHEKKKGAVLQSRNQVQMNKPTNRSLKQNELKVDLKAFNFDLNACSLQSIVATDQGYGRERVTVKLQRNVDYSDFRSKLKLID